MQNSLVILTFPALDWKYRFWGNLIQKDKIVYLMHFLVLRLIWICRIEYRELTFSVFDWKYCLGKFGPSNGTSYINLIWNFVLRLIWIQYAKFNGDVQFFFVLDSKYPFWANLVQKIEIFVSIRNLVIRLIWIYSIQQWCSVFLL